MDLSTVRAVAKTTNAIEGYMTAYVCLCAPLCYVVRQARRDSVMKRIKKSMH
jgi:hypothetical protein